MMVRGTIFRKKGTHHAPAVASYKVNAVIKNCTSRSAAAFQDRCLKNIPLVTFWIIAFHKHDIKVGETCTEDFENNLKQTSLSFLTALKIISIPKK